LLIDTWALATNEDDNDDDEDDGDYIAKILCSVDRACQYNSI